jgi:branched-chain amino acid transport system substrate-binding protein
VHLRQQIAVEDTSSNLARRWYEREGVQVIVDMPNSGTALAVQEIARNLKRINITTTAGSLALTNKSCSPTSFHWMWDTYSNSYGLVKALAWYRPPISLRRRFE